MVSWAPGRICLRCHGAARSIALFLRSLPFTLCVTRLRRLLRSHLECFCSKAPFSGF